jgi:hypothetical protein
MQTTFAATHESHKFTKQQEVLSWRKFGMDYFGSIAWDSDSASDIKN